MLWRELVRCSAFNIMEDLLIEKVRSHVCLYDIRCPDYRDNEKRISAWEEIGAELNISAEKAKKEWEKLRRCFTNALHRRRQKKNLPDGGAKKIPAWKYETEMSFLMPSYKVKRPRHHLQYQVEEVEEADVSDYHGECIDSEQSFKSDDHLVVDEDATPSNHQSFHPQFPSNVQTESSATNLNESRKRRRHIVPDDNSVDGMVDCILRESSPRRNRNDEVIRHFDENDMFFLSLARTTKTLPLIEQAKVKLMVSQTVLQAQISVSKQNAHPRYSDDYATLNVDEHS